MSCMKAEILNEASVDLVDRCSIISSSDTFKVTCIGLGLGLVSR